MHDDDDDVGCFVLSDGAPATDAGDQPTSAFADFTFASYVEAENSFIGHCRCRVVPCREDLCTAEKTRIVQSTKHGLMTQASCMALQEQWSKTSRTS